VSKGKKKGEIIAQLQRDMMAQDIQLQRITGARTYAGAFLAWLMKKEDIKKEEKKDAIQKKG